jgi:hypothetical protein
MDLRRHRRSVCPAALSLLLIAGVAVAGDGLPTVASTPRVPYTAWSKATFSDVPFDFWSWRWIESIYAAGLTAGCATTPFPAYCPQDVVNRAMMAVFLLRGKHGASYLPPPATGTVFTDVGAQDWAAAWIEELAAEGITAGCGDSRFCPASPVTRAQMAVFLLASEHGASYVPPPPTGTVFTDVGAQDWAAAWIEELAAEGITAGCGGGMYCPYAAVDRGQMAVFLAATFVIPLVDPPTTPTLGGCLVLPANNIWNAPVDALPVDAHSADYIATIGADTGLHPDFGSGTWQGAPIGIPFIVVPGTQPMVPVSFDYADESDPGPYPIPPDAPIEGGADSTGDRHVLVLDNDTCVLYEMFDAWPQTDGSWIAGSGAMFNFTSNALRPAGWTSADAAGLPILPGLVRYDEVAAGAIKHAIRFTAALTQKAYVWPARHYASNSTDPARPPMGQRFRLKASFDISGFSPQVQVILTALKTYGLILADNGSNWYLSGVPDERWDNDVLHTLDNVKGSDFEAVDCSSLMVDPDSGGVP